MDTRISVEQFNALIIYIDDNIDYKEDQTANKEFEMLKSYDTLYKLIVED